MLTCTTVCNLYPSISNPNPDLASKEGHGWHECACVRQWASGSHVHLKGTSKYYYNPARNHSKPFATLNPLLFRYSFL